MLLTRSQPPQFLLPAWSTQQLLKISQRAHQSTKPQKRPDQIIPALKGASAYEDKDVTTRRLVASDHTPGERERSVRDTRNHFEKPGRRQGRSTTDSQDKDDGGTRRTSNFRFVQLASESARLIRKVSQRPTETPENKAREGKLASHNGRQSVSSRRERWPPLQGLTSSTDSTHSLQEDAKMLPSQKPPAVSGNEPPVRNPTSKARPQKKLKDSLFDELFPEENELAGKKDKVLKTVDRLPVFDWDAGPRMDWKETIEKDAAERRNVFHKIPKLKARPEDKSLALLVLNSTSKKLEESDFFRLGAQGDHIEGWTSGIRKVIQARDPLTLEPLGHYFIVFSNDSAASLYLDNMRRLHNLARTHSGPESPLLLPSKLLRPGEDIKTVLRGYSLATGQRPLWLRMLKKPYMPSVEQLLRDGGPVAIARQRTNSEDMVLFSLDSGRIGWYGVKTAIQADGKKRNLHWQLSEGEHAIVKVENDRWSEEEVRGFSQNGLPKWRSAPGPTRFIISFKDSHEARRFVREWHRRPFPVQMDPRLGEEYPRLGDEYPSMINAEMFW